jgi:hypothetical protein
MAASPQKRAVQSVATPGQNMAIPGRPRDGACGHYDFTVLTLGLLTLVLEGHFTRSFSA